MKVCFVSLGCDKNLVDLEYMMGLVKKHGFDITNDEQNAEILIVNTCGFIETAKQESIDTILEMAQLKKRGKCKFLIATGCLAQRYKEILLEEMPELDAIVGTGDFYKLPKVIEKLGNGKMKKINLTKTSSSFINYDINNRILATPYTSFVKIAEGCNNICSYCAIPAIRGRYKSRKIESIKKEVEILVSSGIREINLVAQDTTYYGIDIYGRPSLSELLKQLVKIDGQFIIRILYAYPTNIDNELLMTIKDNTKIARYLDIPLQHINNRILKKMNRPTDSHFIKQLIDNIRNIIPDITLRTTFIVGFPTETVSEFNELLKFISKYEFDHVGAFPYSREDGTLAANFKPQVSEKTKIKRYNKLMKLQQSISKKKNKKYKGKTINVLTETFDVKDNMYIGRSEKDAPFVDGVVKFKGEDCILGEVYPVKVHETLEYDLKGEIVN